MRSLGAWSWPLWSQEIAYSYPQQLSCSSLISVILHPLLPSQTDHSGDTNDSSAFITPLCLKILRFSFHRFLFVPSYPCGWFLTQCLSWSPDPHFHLPNRNSLLSGPRVSSNIIMLTDSICQNHLQLILLLHSLCPITWQLHRFYFCYHYLSFYSCFCSVQASITSFLNHHNSLLNYLLATLTLLYIATRVGIQGHLQILWTCYLPSTPALHSSPMRKLTDSHTISFLCLCCYHPLCCPSIFVCRILTTH